MKLAQGAESIIWLKDNKIVKERFEKKYRHPEIDFKIRKKTTRFESRLLEKAHRLIPVPKVLNSSDKDMLIVMEHIQGEKLKDIIDKADKNELIELFKIVGKQVALLHNSNIIHGDLTTSNMILNDKLYFIDFGLGFISAKIEDKAVDLHLLKQALESKHHEHAETCFEAVLNGYSKTVDNFNAIIERLTKVEMRGRYKMKKTSLKLNSGK